MAPGDNPPTVLADAGFENVNAQVDELIDSGSLRRLLALTEVGFSNSMIESWWRTLKQQCLYLNTLDCLSSLQRLVSFHVEEHNTRLPHSAFREQTLDETYFGTDAHVLPKLDPRRMAARAVRLEVKKGRVLYAL